MSTETKTYNGWTNYETWNVALWIDNEEGSYRYWRDTMRDLWDHAEAHPHEHWTRSEQARFTLADRLKNELEESKPELGASMWSDLLNAALSEVNWNEIAGNWLAEIDGYEEAE